MDAFKVSDEQDVSPWDALPLIVRRRAARVVWIDSIIDGIVAEQAQQAADAGVTPPTSPPASVREWMRESRDEEKLVASAAKMSIDAGVATEMVRRMRLEGRVAVDAIVAALDAIGASDDQRVAAIEAAHQVLSAGPDAPAARLAVEGIIDDPQGRQQRTDDDDT